MATPAGELALLLILLSAVLIFFAWWARRLRKGIRLQLWAVALFGLFYVPFLPRCRSRSAPSPLGDCRPSRGILRRPPAPARCNSGVSVHRANDRVRTIGIGSLDVPGPVRDSSPVARLLPAAVRVELALLGRVYLFTPTPGHAVSIPTFAVALIVVDALFAASTGARDGERPRDLLRLPKTARAATGARWSHGLHRNRRPTQVGREFAVNERSPYRARFVRAPACERSGLSPRLES